MNDVNFLREYLISEGKSVNDAYVTYIRIASHTGHFSVSRKRFIQEVETACGLKVVDKVFQKKEE